MYYQSALPRNTAFNKIRMKSILVFSAAFLLLACSKHKGDVEESIPQATVTYHSPMPNAVYHTGDTIPISITATATAEMHGYAVSIRNAADTSIVYFLKEAHAHGDSLMIDERWKDTLTSATNLQVALVLTLDHEGHTNRSTTSIRSEP